jgi:hypothetical protein
MLKKCAYTTSFRLQVCLFSQPLDFHIVLDIVLLL